MLLSVSILSIKDNIKEKIRMLNQTSIDYLHLDIMDEIFVPNKTWTIDQIMPLLDNSHKALDIHLMVSDIIKYIDDYKILNPKYITFHLEATEDPLFIINYLKKNNLKVGISIKPSTPVSALSPYLELVDLVLLMSVEPGFGGQLFIPQTENKINELYDLKTTNNYSFVIEVDGGINETTIKHCLHADMVVLGSYITNSSDYQQEIDKIKN